MVIGRRTSRTRPMGYLRGELEELADRVLLDALQYDAAVQGRPLRLEFVMPSGEFPDFHSGYKLFDRATAESVFLSEPPDVGLQEEAGYRHAVEAVIIVEALRHGAVPAEVVRSTYNEQPISTFALLSRPRMVADKILWPCKRLGVPGAFVGQWVDNHLARLELGTLAPEGRQELLTIRNLVRAGYGLPDDGRTEIRGPRFV